MTILNKGTGQPIDQNTPVNLMDLSGAIKTVPASEATSLLNDQGSEYQIASPSQVQEHKDYVQYTSPSAKVKTALEGGANTLTAGILPAIIDKTMNEFAPGAAAEYQKNREARSEYNPFTSMAGGAIGFLTPGGAASTLEKGAAEIVGTKAATSLGKIAQKTATGFLTGGAYGLTSEVAPRLIDGHPLSIDAIVDSTWKDALGFGLPHLVLSGAGEALTGVNKVKNTALNYFTKGVGALEGTPVTQAITASELPALETSYGKKGVTLNATDIPGNDLIPPETKYKLQNGKTTVNIDGKSIGGNGANFDNPAGLQEIGNQNQITDLPAKYRTLKQPGETPKDFLTRIKQEQYKTDWLKDNDFVLKPAEEKILSDNQTAFDNYKANPDDPKAIADYVNSHQKAINLYEDVHSQKAVVPDIEKAKVERKLNGTASQVSKWIDGLDHARADGELHVFNKDVIGGDLTQVIGEQIKPEMKKIINELNVSQKAQGKIVPGGINTATEYAQSLFPAEGEALPQGAHLIDYLTDKNEGNIAKFGPRVGNIVNAAISRLEESGLNTQMTYEHLANEIDKLANQKYAEPISGNAKAGNVEQFDMLKKYAKELRANGIDSTNKYGDPVYKKLSFGELRDVRLDMDNTAFKSNADPIIKEGAGRLRDFIEKHVLETLGKNSPDLQAAYSKAKLDFHTAKTMQTLLDGASQKAFQKAATAGSFGSTYLASKIARRVLGPYGELATIALGSTRGAGIFNTVSEGATQHFSNAMAENVTKYQNLLGKAAAGAISPKPSQYSVLSPGKQKTYAEIQKDEKSLMEAKAGQESYFNDFMNRNEGSFGAAPKTMQGFVQKTINANNFLLGKIPKNPYENTPWRKGQWEPSQVEIDKYFRYKEAVLSPSKILRQFSNGYVSPESLEVLTQVFPQTKMELQSKVLQNIKSEIPQEKRVLLFKAFGIPMDGLSFGRLFGEMQGNASLMIQQESQQNGVINPSKVSNPMAQLTTGQQSLANND